MIGAEWGLWPGVLVSFGVGLALGLFYFGGLWWTVQAVTRSARPTLLFFSSFIVRLVVVLAALYLLGAGHWERMAAALVAMILMRFYLTHRLGPPHVGRVRG